MAAAPCRAAALLLAAAAAAAAAVGGAADPQLQLRGGMEERGLHKKAPASHTGNLAQAVPQAANVTEPTSTWTWREQDTRALAVCITLGCSCSLIAAALLAAAAAAHRSQQRAGCTSGDVQHPFKVLAATVQWEPISSPHVTTIQPASTDSCCDKLAETTPLLEQPACRRQEEDPKARPHMGRVIGLVFIGLAPLANCVLIGESLEDVLIAMVSMHWGCMLVLPALYYAVRSHEDPGFVQGTAAFYGRQLPSAHCRHLASKCLRGLALGVPTFLCLCVGYLSFRCKTARWLFCIKNFRRPLEEYGFAPHSMPFRVLAALYFTFWNPVMEEFFWRVYLHRELGAEYGVERVEETKFEIAEKLQEEPWPALWRDLKSTTPWGAARVRWGVSVLYASYHTWPVKVVFQQIWWAYVAFAFLSLVGLGRVFVALRENPHFGLPAAYILHVWVDAGFALLCLFEVHPAELFAMAA